MRSPEKAPVTVSPSGLRRRPQAPARKGVGSSPTAVTSPHAPNSRGGNRKRRTGGGARRESSLGHKHGGGLVRCRYAARAGEGVCRDPGSSWGPSDLRSDALPTELSRLWQEWRTVLVLTHTLRASGARADRRAMHFSLTQCSAFYYSPPFPKAGRPLRGERRTRHFPATTAPLEGGGGRCNKWGRSRGPWPPAGLRSPARAHRAGPPRAPGCAVCTVASLDLSAPQPCQRRLWRPCVHQGYRAPAQDAAS